MTALPLSVAVTLTVITPTLAFDGVPLKVWVAALNASHDGRALPSERLAVRVKLSPTSISAKTFESSLRLITLFFTKL